jgi:succinate dehydrogenase / fumarate reductase membrane anchor subunit
MTDSTHNRRLRTPLGRARGLGAAKKGVGHWWVQRVTAVALVPLIFWFVASIIGLIGADHASFVAWIRHPLNTILMVLLVGVGFHHLQLGLQVVIEDYVHNEAVKVVSMVALVLLTWLFAGLSVVSILKVALGS